MATQEQIQRVLSLMKETVPGPLCRRIDESSSGAAAVMGCLYHTGQTQTAGQLSARCHVSTARMAVLLKKMEGRGLITRFPGEKDARTVEIALTPRGLAEAQAIGQELERQVGILIDRIGEDRLTAFAQVAREIGETMQGTALDRMERTLTEDPAPGAKEEQP